MVKHDSEAVVVVWCARADSQRCSERLGRFVDAIECMQRVAAAGVQLFVVIAGFESFVVEL